MRRCQWGMQAARPWARCCLPGALLRRLSRKADHQPSGADPARVRQTVRVVRNHFGMIPSGESEENYARSQAFGTLLPAWSFAAPSVKGSRSPAFRGGPCMRK